MGIRFPSLCQEVIILFHHVPVWEVTANRNRCPDISMIPSVMDYTSKASTVSVTVGDVTWRT